MIQAEDVEDFRRRLAHGFPARAYYGVVSTHDECDDGNYVRTELRGKRWDELSPEVLFHGSICLPLLTPDALVTFLPAWLLRSMQTWGRDSVVLEFTQYFLCPGSADEGWDEVRIASLVALFDRAQRRSIADFLRSIAGDEELWFWHPSVQFGLTWWSSGETSGAPDPGVRG